MRPSAAFAAMILPPLMAACGSGGSSGAGPTDLPLLALSPTPTLEIGVIEGDPSYQFQEIVTVLRLPSGDIAVSDAGGARIVLYRSDGTFRREFGGQGGGPGEFGRLSRLYLAGDGLTALDGRNDRFSVFDAEGTYRGTRPRQAFSQDSTFYADVWLYGRFWVDGALEDEVRARVRAVLDGLPSPVAPPGFRYVRVAADGRLWIREPGTAGDGTRAWTILDADGSPVAQVRIPIRFDPLHIRADELLGRWVGEADVHFARAYDVVETGATTPAPNWLRPAEPSASAEPADETDVRDLVRQAIRQMASAQEIHYLEHSTYTTEIDALERWEQPEGIDVTFVTADRRGWSAAFAHPGYDRVCALGYGASMPPGWIPGMVICAPPRSSPDSEVN